MKEHREKKAVEWRMIKETEEKAEGREKLEQSVIADSKKEEQFVRE